MAPVIQLSLDRKITWGGMLTIAMVLLTAGINWGVSQSQAKQTEADIRDLKVEVRENIETLSGQIDVIKADRFNDNSRMIRVETLLGEILEEVKARR